MAIDDFEWEREPELGEAVAHAPPPPAESWLSRCKKSVWLAPVLRLGGMALLLGVLAGIGIVATTYAKPGLPLPEGSRALVDALGTGWLKPTMAAPSAAAPRLAVAPASSVAPRPPSAAPSLPATESAPGAGPGPGLEPAPGQPPPPGPAGITADGKVILNVASAEELTRLPGVGAKRAEAIVALRSKLKRFRQVTDLLRVKGIGPRGLKRMLPHLVLDAPS